MKQEKPMTPRDTPMTDAEIRRLIEAEIAQREPTVRRSDPSYWAYSLCLGSIAVGPDANRIAQIMDLPLEPLAPMVERLQKNGVWGADGRVHADWNDPKNGGVALALDVAVALGYLEKVGDHSFINPEKNN
jgi:hypothetical protein